jgi:hypothetical protein
MQLRITNKTVRPSERKAALNQSTPIGAEHAKEVSGVHGSWSGNVKSVGSRSLNSNDQIGFFKRSMILVYVNADCSR